VGRLGRREPARSCPRARSHPMRSPPHSTLLVEPITMMWASPPAPSGAGGGRSPYQMSACVRSSTTGRGGGGQPEHLLARPPA
jgi:hypothetical protein